jgi:hypothetical protein
MTKALTTKNSPLAVIDPNLAALAIVSSNHEGPISIQGVARARIPDTEIVAYFLVYKVVDQIDRLNISEEFYDQMRTIFDAIKYKHTELLYRFIDSAPNRMKK